ncbi:hypothetical protein ES288_D08G139600v1 [Gossypium darwinii]|uniref:RanBP2-type domain-containing protein n=1 Tax=Gossypium darwinii TaxID=34276 RepID=A0A5D2BLH7_GOSDA|nr:hypothetical protein ES288_D08G139600v1 [Gossypium darwinii]
MPYLSKSLIISSVFGFLANLHNPHREDEEGGIRFWFLVNSTFKSWSCTKCTFLNSPSQTAACKVCLSPPSPSRSSPSKWACKACTFLNLYNKSNCEICIQLHSPSFP